MKSGRGWLEQSSPGQLPGSDKDFKARGHYSNETGVRASVIRHFIEDGLSTQFFQERQDLSRYEAEIGEGLAPIDRQVERNMLDADIAKLH